MLHTKFHQDNMSVCFIPPYTPFSHSKTGVYRGLHYFLIFALKHILWVFVRTASMRRSYRVPTIYVWSKNMKIHLVKKFQLKNVIFTDVKNRCIMHWRFYVMQISIVDPGNMIFKVYLPNMGMTAILVM